MRRLSAQNSSMKIPDFIVHYSRGEPFRSMTSLCGEDGASALRALNETNTWGLARFADPEYLTQRYRVEEDIRKRFVEIGGKPQRQNPIYFFLGRNLQFEKNERNIGYVIPLRDIDPRAISFSYGDSMFCFDRENRHRAGEKYQNPLCEDLYLLENLQQLVEHPNFPTEEPLHIEAHLWVTPDPSLAKSLTRSMPTSRPPEE